MREYLAKLWNESCNFNEEMIVVSILITNDYYLLGGNSNFLEGLWSECTRTDARRPADGQFPFFTAPSLKRVLRRTLVFLTITAMYKGKMREERGIKVRRDRPANESA